MEFALNLVISQPKIRFGTQNISARELNRWFGSSPYSAHGARSSSTPDFIRDRTVTSAVPLSAAVLPSTEPQAWARLFQDSCNAMPTTTLSNTAASPPPVRNSADSADSSVVVAAQHAAASAQNSATRSAASVASYASPAAVPRGSTASPSSSAIPLAENSSSVAWDGICPVPTHTMVTRSKNDIYKPSPRIPGGQRQSMLEELEALKCNNTWELVPRQPKMNVVGCKWVLRLRPKFGLI
ncbi:hypothetical protein CRG98_046446 [Punica granatum]|uniref:Reverse transcriptase Ty1/copia-type domain-containing protein n=1 Tax=Punica granatum TaxID=22663 RepID=A0A2I0HN84_PUNGR|nr:hypothetical protein CRG98_046446 [Punica granatum]